MLAKATAVSMTSLLNCALNSRVSDSPFSIDSKIADYSINVSVESNTFINSYAAIISVMNAIVTAIGIKYPKDTMRSLDDIENCLQDSELGEY